MAESDSCSICLSSDFSDDRKIVLNCSHYFHESCLIQWNNTSPHRNCPICRQQMNIEVGDTNFKLKWESQLIKLVVKCFDISSFNFIPGQTITRSKDLFSFELTTNKVELFNKAIHSKFSNTNVNNSTYIPIYNVRTINENIRFDEHERFLPNSFIHIICNNHETDRKKIREVYIHFSSRHHLDDYKKIIHYLENIRSNRNQMITNVL